MPSAPIALFTRKAHFSSAHRLQSEHLSVEENAALYGVCNNLNGHGHNYTIEVTVRGPVDCQTGMVMNLSELKAAMQRAIIDNLDFKNLDKDVPFFANIPSTSENVARFVWDSVYQALERPELLYEVTVSEYETDKSIVTYRGPRFQLEECCDD